MHRKSGVEFLELAKFRPTHWTETSHGYHGHINKSKIDQMFLVKKCKRLLIWFIQVCFYRSRLKDPAQVFLNDLQSCREWVARADLQHQLLFFPASSANHHAWRTSAMGWQTCLWTQRPRSQKETQSESQTAYFTSLPMCPYFGIYTLCHPSHTAHI